MRQAKVRSSWSFAMALFTVILLSPPLSITDCSPPIQRAPTSIARSETVLPMFSLDDHNNPTQTDSAKLDYANQVALGFSLLRALARLREGGMNPSAGSSLPYIRFRPLETAWRADKRPHGQPTRQA